MGPDVAFPASRGYRVTVACECGHSSEMALDSYRHYGTLGRFSRALRCRRCGRRGPFGTERLQPPSEAIRGNT